MASLPSIGEIAPPFAEVDDFQFPYASQGQMGHPICQCGLIISEEAC